MKNTPTTQCEAARTHHTEWETYLMWAADSFKLTSGTDPFSGQEASQAMAQLATIVSHTAAQHDLQLLESFEEYEYPNEIGPYVYDIHGACLSDIDWMADRLDKALLSQG